MAERTRRKERDAEIEALVLTNEAPSRDRGMGRARGRARGRGRVGVGDIKTLVLTNTALFPTRLFFLLLLFTIRTVFFVPPIRIFSLLLLFADEVKARLEADIRKAEMV